MSPQLVIIGAGGHARVLAEIVRLGRRFQLVGFTDPDPKLRGENILGSPILGPDDILPDLLTGKVMHSIIGVGSTGDNHSRRLLFEKVRALGFQLASLFHPAAVISPQAQLGNGVAVMAGAVMNSAARCGDNVIVNSGVIIEHDCSLGDHVHVASGACLAGGVQVGRESHIGLRASIIQNVRIGEKALVGAGAVVIHDVPAGMIVMGVPAKVVGERKE